MAIDLYSNIAVGLNDPNIGGFAVTPSDDNELVYITRHIYVGTTGHLKVTMYDDTVLTFNNLLQGVRHEIRAKKIHSTGTTATGILGLI